MQKPLLIVFFLLALMGAVAQKENVIDSLEKELKWLEGAERSKALMDLSALYQSTSIDKSLEYDLENVALQRSLGSMRNLSSTLNNIGISYYMKGDYGKSLDYFEQSLVLHEQLNDTVSIVKTLNNLGVISQTAGNFDKALEYLQRSLIFKLDLNDTLSTAKTLNNIGVIYKDVNNYADARKFLLQALNYYQLLDNQSGIAAAFNNLGQVFEAENYLDSALVYYQKSLDIKREIGDERGIGNSLNNIGMIYMLLGSLQKAEKYFDEAIEIRQITGDKFGIASTLNNLGNLYFKLRKYSLAEEYFNRSNDLANEENLMGIKQRNFAGLYRLYETKGNPGKALEYFKEYSATRDSIFNNDLNNQLADLKVKYESEKSKRELEMLRQQNQIQELELLNSQNQRIHYIAGIIALFFVSIITGLYLQYRNKKRLSNQLQNYTRELELRVNERTRELKEANDTKDRFFSIIAHDLKSPFNGLLGFTSIMNDDFEMLDDEQKREMSGYIQDSALSIYKLLENLLEWSSSQTGRLKLNPEKLELKEIIDQIIKTNTSVLQTKQITVDTFFNTQNTAFADKDTINTVVRNLLSNAIKFTPKGGKIEISIFDNEDKNEIILSVKDTGVGISAGNMEKLFKLQQIYRSEGTEKESGTGLGLILCKEFVEKNGGHLFAESTPGKGSIFSFSLPMATV